MNNKHPINNESFEKQFNRYIFVWNFAIKNLTALFIILEGICSLLLIQAIGKSFNWLVYRSNDAKSTTHNEYRVLLNLLISGTVLTISFYFLYNIFTIPDLKINLISSTLLGSIITYCLGLSLFGIVSSKGTLIESVLIFSYIVKCIYQTFPELTTSTNDQINELITKTTSNFKKEFDNNIFSLKTYDFSNNFFVSFYQLNFKQFLLNDRTQESITQMIGKKINDTPFISTINHSPTVLTAISSAKIFIKMLTLNLTNSFLSLIIFMIDAVNYLTLLLVFNLAYRILVFYAATRIIPALKQSMKSGILSNPAVNGPEKEDIFQDDGEIENENEGEGDGDGDDEDKRNALYDSESEVFSLSSSSTSGKQPILDYSSQSKIRYSIDNIMTEKLKPVDKGYKPLDKARVIYSYSPCLIIAVYTNLMLLQRNEIDQNLIIWGWWMENAESWIVVNQIQFWNWLNMLLLLGLYTLELFTETDDWIECHADSG